MTDEQIREWNATFKPGHPCWLRYDNGDEFSTKIRGEAWRSGDNHVVVRVEGLLGSWDIDRLKMIEVLP